MADKAKRMTLKVTELVLDFSLYPRAEVDSHHVTSIAQAMANGVTMPSVVICGKTKRVVDGFHRIRAMLRLYGEDHATRVIAKRYKSEAELFLDAMRYNADHGRALTTYDKAHCALRASELQIDDDTVADCLHVDPAWVGGLRVDRTAVSGKLHVPLKRTIKHMAGKKLTRKQQETNKKLGGMQQLFYVNQLIMLLEDDLLDKSNDGLLARLVRLGELIETVQPVAVAG